MGDYLSTPDKTKHSEEGSNHRVKNKSKVLILNLQISFGATTMQGWRKSQEDAHIAELDIGDGNSLFAVFDGHGGMWILQFKSYLLYNLLLLINMSHGDIIFTYNTGYR